MIAARPGFYGKLASAGDFVSRALPRSFIDPWDRWLQAGMHASREQLGDAWLPAYLTSSVWRFALSSGLCGEDAWGGVLMPSVDKVGRHFPLTTVIACDPTLLLHSLMYAGDWFDAVEQCLLASLEDELEADSLAALLAQCAQPQFTLRPAHDLVLEASSSAFVATFASLEEARASLPECLAFSLRQQFGEGVTFWWVGESEFRPAMLRACKGLPPKETFAALLDGAATREPL